MKRTPLIVGLTLAALGGVYFGLFSCGGYLSHRQVFFGLLALATLAAIVIPFQKNSPVLSRLGVIAAIALTFIFTEALAAPFYPSQPESLPEFLRLFVSAMAGGSC